MIRTPETIQSEVSKLLKSKKIDTNNLPIDIEEVAHSLGAKVVYSPMEDELCGMIFKDNNDFIIGINSLHPKNRQRFTLAHEIAHLYLHKNEIGEGVHVDSSFTESLKRDNKSSKGIDTLEIEANRFAAELLMPTSKLKNEIKNAKMDYDSDTLIQELANKFQVSVQSMAIKLSKCVF